MKKLTKRVCGLFLAMIMLVAMAQMGVVQLNAAESFLWPVPASQLITQGPHGGGAIDIGIAGNAQGSTIVATKSGVVKVVYVGCNNNDGYSTGCSSSKCVPSHGFYYDSTLKRSFCNNSYGNGIIIQHHDGTYSYYAHLRHVNVSTNQNVSQGQQIGTMGSSGCSGGTHLHFAISYSYNSNYINAHPNNTAYIYSTTPNPANAWISIPKPSLAVNEEVTFSLGADNVTGGHYVIHFHKDGASFANITWGDGYYTRSFSAPGNYTASITAYNTSGVSCTSATIAFTVHGSAPTKPTMSFNLRTFAPGERTAITWSSSNYDQVIMAVWDQNWNMVVNPTVTNTPTYYIDLSPGTYYIQLDSYNAAGHSFSDVETIWVANVPRPSKPMVSVSVNSSTGTATLTWGATSNTTWYDARIYRSDGTVYHVQFNVNNLQYSIQLPAGQYYATVTSVNGDYLYYNTPSDHTSNFAVNIPVLDKPSLSVSYLQTPDGVKFTWSNVPNSTWYDLRVYHSNGSLYKYYFEIPGNSFTAKLPHGDYYARLSAVNGNYIGCNTASDFTSVFSAYPVPTVSTQKKIYNLNEDVTFSFSALGATNIALYIYLEGALYYEGGFSPGEVFTRKLTGTGHYDYFIHAYYANGSIQSEWDDLDVGIAPQAPSITTNKTDYEVGESINILITVAHKTKNAWLKIYDDEDNIVISQDVTLCQLFVPDIHLPGTYRVECQASNEFGDSPIVINHFTISSTYYPLIGDLDFDGAITIADALLALRSTTGEVVLTDEQKLLADVNSDGFVDITDALMILRYTTGEISAFPKFQNLI